MKTAIQYVMVFFLFFAAACTTQQKVQPDEEFAVDAGGTAADKDLTLDELDDGEVTASAGPESTSADVSADLELENELNNLDQAAGSGSSELSLDDPALAEATAAPPPLVDPNTTAAEPPLIEETPLVPAPDLVAESAPPVLEELGPVAQIDRLEYKANDSGGTVVIGANQPLNYTTRFNSATNQFIVEVNNALLPQNLKRSLNTKDMASSIGSVDVYQKDGSNVSRFVVQLRPGAAEPIVQPEGNSLLVVGGSQTPAITTPPITPDISSTSEDNDFKSNGIMNSESLEEFLMSNNKFYGKLISIETNAMDIKEFVKFLAEESGVNIIMDEDVAGAVSVKLKDVPWDQAFVLMLKQKKLAYVRQGNVLRVAQLDALRRDEDEAIKLMQARKNKAPFIVRRFYINYANLADLATKITEFVSTTEKVAASAAGAAVATPDPAANIGKVISDTRTNSIIVTDTEENMGRIEKLITALDTQPQQVLIEGKVVEAKESFTKSLGVNWTSEGLPSGANNSANLTIKPDVSSLLSVLDTSVSWGNLNIFGNLSAQLLLGEKEDKIKVLSSPRITVLSNQEASIAQTTTISIPISTTENTTTGTATTTTTTQRVDVGITLKVKPQVSYDGLVTMNLDIDRSLRSSADSVDIDRRTAKTQVIVKSGQTTVIGGIFESQASAVNSGVPGLRNVPLLGKLFEANSEQTSKNELIIFLTPNIIKTAATITERPSSDIE